LTAATAQPIERRRSHQSTTPNVLIPFLWLIVLIGSTPAIVFFDGPMERGIMAAATALATAIVGALMRSGDAGRLAPWVARWAPVAALPALWMALQAVPIPLSSLAHPIWTDAAAALNSPVVGAISIDPGMTLLALGRYLFPLGVGFVAAAVAIDRERAQLTLFVLVGTTTVLAAVVIAAGRAGLGAGAADGAAIATAAVGTIISAAATLHAAEKIEMLRERTNGAIARSAAVFVACAFAWAICGYAVVHSSPKQIQFAAACGLAVLALIVAARRIGVGIQIVMAIAAAGLVAAVGIAASGADTGDPFLRFAVAEPVPAIERMLADTGLAGSGGGTVSALLPIYGTVADIASGATASTAAAAGAIELGRPMWVLLVVIAIAAAGALLGAALRRGRDWCYPGAAASCIIAAVLESFVDLTLFATAVMVITSAAIGLGLAQSVGRSVR
jgi:hypothetical protein